MDEGDADQELIGQSGEAQDARGWSKAKRWLTGVSVVAVLAFAVNEGKMLKEIEGVGGNLEKVKTEHIEPLRAEVRDLRKKTEGLGKEDVSQGADLKRIDDIEEAVEDFKDDVHAITTSQAVAEHHRAVMERRFDQIDRELQELTRAANRLEKLEGQEAAEIEELQCAVVKLARDFFKLRCDYEDGNPAPGGLTCISPNVEFSLEIPIRRVPNCPQ